MGATVEQICVLQQDTRQTIWSHFGNSLASRTRTNFFMNIGKLNFLFLFQITIISWAPMGPRGPRTHILLTLFRNTINIFVKYHRRNLDSACNFIFVKKMMSLYGIQKKIFLRISVKQNQYNFFNESFQNYVKLKF